MAIEREQKFLVKNDGFFDESYSIVIIEQGYLHLNPSKCVRVRLVTKKSNETSAYLTIKGESTKDGLERYEFETEIPYSDGLGLLKLCGDDVIKKIRYFVKAEGDSDLVWEVDVFTHTDLVLAEIETSSEQDKFKLPDWIGEEVTGNIDYYNTSILDRIKSGVLQSLTGNVTLECGDEPYTFFSRRLTAPVLEFEEVETTHTDETTGKKTTVYTAGKHEWKPLQWDFPNSTYNELLELSKKRRRYNLTMHITDPTVQHWELHGVEFHASRRENTLTVYYDSASRLIIGDRDE